MNQLADQLRYRHENKFLCGQMLSRAVTLASSIGEMAEKGKRFTLNEKSKDRFIGMVQLGEYILTGAIPAPSLVLNVVEVKS